MFVSLSFVITTIEVSSTVEERINASTNFFLILSDKKQFLSICSCLSTENDSLVPSCNVMEIYLPCYCLVNILLLKCCCLVKEEWFSFLGLPLYEQEIVIISLFNAGEFFSIIVVPIIEYSYFNFASFCAGNDNQIWSHNFMYVIVF